MDADLRVGVLLEETLQLLEADLAVLLAGAAQLEHGLQLRLVPHHRHLLFDFPALTEDPGRGAKSHLGTVTGLDTVLHIHNPVRQTPKITVDVLPNKSPAHSTVTLYQLAVADHRNNRTADRTNQRTHGSEHRSTVKLKS